MIEMTAQEFEALRKKAFALVEERGLSGGPLFNPAVECCAWLGCGGSCFLPSGHSGEHGCIGDCDGPGSCPA